MSESRSKFRETSGRILDWAESRFEQGRSVAKKEGLALATYGLVRRLQEGRGRSMISVEEASAASSRFEEITLSLDQKAINRRFRRLAAATIIEMEDEGYVVDAGAMDAKPMKQKEVDTRFHEITNPLSVEMDYGANDTNEQSTRQPRE